MIVLRSWPATVPPGRAHVIDDIPRYVLGDYDYRGMFDEVDDDLLLLEWDVAASAEHLDDFRDLIATDPQSVHAAPYRIYMLRRARGPRWVMRHLNPDAPADLGSAEWANEGDPTSHLFGFGMTYVPREVWRAFASANREGVVNDTRFSKWHHDHVRADQPIPWHIRPVHLHFQLAPRLS